MEQVASIVAVFGTRPEIIKLAPVFRALASEALVHTTLISTGQQQDLLPAFLEGFGIHIDESLGTMVRNQSLNESLAGMLGALDRVLERAPPALVMVQGDTTSALAGALAARFRGIPVAHIEAGLRTGNPDSPFPEESNRTLISRVAALHFAPTEGNLENLHAEGIPPASVIVSGNPIVDAIDAMRGETNPSQLLADLLTRFGEKKIIVLTLHRRENFNQRLADYVHVISTFLDQHENYALVVPVHPNPKARDAIYEGLAGRPRVALIEPLPYGDFFCLLESAALVLSDSGGIQEEVVTLGKPLLILRKETERPEAIASGTARLAPTATDLASELESVIAPDSWVNSVTPRDNPFGDGRSGPRIARAMSEFVRAARNGGN